MAQPPAPGSGAVADPAAASRSHGRGGAGNITRHPPAQLEAADLETPTIKSSLYTTGRGGSGNMAKNDPAHAAETRAAQDVEAPAHHSKDMHGTYHWGRGGEGNMTTLGPSGSSDGQNRRPSVQTALSKGKEMLGLGRKDKAGPGDGGAGQTPEAKEAKSGQSDSAIAD